MTVRGYIGQEQVELTDAATDTTLKQLVRAVGILSAKSGDNLEINQKALDEFFKNLGPATEAAKKYQEKLKENTEGLEENEDALDKLNRAYDQHEDRIRESRERFRGLSAISRKLVGAFDGLLEFVSKTTSDLTAMGNSAGGAVNVLSNIPGVGTRITKAMGPAAESADKLFDSFITASQGGVTFSGSITQLVNSASAAGLTVDEFTSILGETGPQLALLGLGANEGAKRLGNLGRQMRTTGVSEQLTRLGISTAEQNKLIARQAEIRARTGRREQLTDTQLIANTVEYAKNLSAVSRLTGESREALQAQKDAMMADAKFRQMMTEVDPKSAARMEAMMLSLPEGMRAGAMELFSTGVAQSNAAQDFLALNQGAAQEFIRAGRAARSTGSMSEDQMVKTMSVVEAETRKFVESGTFETLAKFVPEFNELIVASMNYAQRTIGIQESLAQATDDINKKGVLPDDFLAEDMKTLKENIAEVSNNVSLFAASSLQIDELNNSIKNTEIVFNEIIGPTFKRFNEAAGAAAETLTELAAAGAKTTSGLGDYVGDIALVALAIGGLLTPLGGLSRLLKGINRTHSPRTNTTGPTPTTRTGPPDIDTQKQNARQQEAARKGRGLTPAEVRDIDKKVELDAKKVGQNVGGSIFKSIMKKIPLISVPLILGGVAMKANAGDYEGAALEALSGLAAQIPGVGTVASLGIDGVNMGRNTGGSEQPALAQLRATPGLTRTFEEQGAQAAIKAVEADYGGRKRDELISLIKQAQSEQSGGGRGSVIEKSGARASSTTSSETETAGEPTASTVNPATATGQDLGTDSIAQLNTNIMELVALMRANNRDTKRAADGLSGMSGDLFVGVG